MRCAEVQRRIESGGSEPDAIVRDPELAAHLAKCPACAQSLEAVLLLNRSLHLASQDDTVGAIPQVDMRKLIEARDGAGAKRSVVGIRPRLRIPRLAPVAALVFAVAIAVVALVPFSYHRTVGYEVSFDGVRADLVSSNDTICDVLYAIGLGEAAVENLGCDTTCHVLIYDLKSKAEVELVVAAMATINEVHLTTNVTPVREPESGTLLGRAGNRDPG